MPVLHNRVSNEELKARMLAETEPRTTVSFYHYFRLDDPQIFRDALYIAFSHVKVFGRVYIAREGINAQVSVPDSHFEDFRRALFGSHPALDGIRLNIALEDDGKSFWVLRMKVRDRIVADGIDDASFDPTQVGQYLKAEEVNRMADDPDTLFVDMRNHYEYEVGHFENAIEVPSDTFREQLPMAVDMLADARDKNIVMYCTGGIRCEKASAYMLHHGFRNVYHVEGGIIEYVRQAKANGLPLRFIGKNFVFDERMGERVSEDVIAHCHQCGEPCDVHVNCKNQGCHLLFIQCPTCAEKYEGCCSAVCQDEIRLPLEEQRQRRKNREINMKTFNKSKGLLNTTLGIPAPEEKK
ncbi:Thiosulfate sulfurtransferase GlpE [Dickeya dianthicola]|uniref:tRNA uridine(34) hydroxylase n=1 Tax=Dickeya dianthicola TaxID=204039 RepID=A0ABX9NLF3_9GAMM|nr:rhodanese-related sulfurtransferase [Dickeya dianthicola]AYC19559.1 Thiosulfate sulfurtransferase GlpE [Dickeya dianthicola]MBI0437518.1 rhodanese-related sulfurtransferase [Dickeya dianthicola]MBI0447780.1 rhodanese-related sulfurtransferase [Dickeya dianthicola]MBI0452397.1 rhodanese-related sulfurtransferase [Dickeya dianthicola]MBI0456890.1 rhodanese-related sulfurtransferase [Dickeya dianthicola]